MKNISNKSLFILALTFAGILGLGLAIFARQLGIDNNDRWGTGRIILAIAGSLSLASAVIILESESLELTIKNVGSAMQNSRLAIWRHSVSKSSAQWITNFPPMKWISCQSKCLMDNWADTAVSRYFSVSRERPVKAQQILLVAVILVIYLWFISVGKMTSLPNPTFYNNMLADAFKHGQTNLLIDPPKQLIALANPYDFRQRQSIGYLWDASLYNGKYYLYWGPVPALIVAGIKAFTPIPISDDVLVLLFLSGFLIVTSLLSLAIWRRLFFDLPGWLVALPVLIAGLGNPVLWLVTRPSVYETASAGGQFFLIGGLYWAITGLYRPRPVAWKLFLAGFCFTLAACTRTSLIAAIMALSLLVIWRAYRLNRAAANSHALIAPLLAVGLPLLVGGIAYGWYNDIRFGSVFETGHQYQLTGMAMPPDYHYITSLRYFIPNLYNYFFRPFNLSTAFPFAIAPVVTDKMWPFFIHLPDYFYYNEPTAGILLTLPYIWFGILSLVWLVRQGRESRNNRGGNSLQPASVADSSLERWVVLIFLITGLSTLAPILVFISSSMRYVEDSVPALILLSSIGIWQVYRSCAQRSFTRALLIFFVLLITCASVILGLLLGISSHAHRFITYNPALYDRLTQFFQ